MNHKRPTKTGSDIEFLSDEEIQHNQKIDYAWQLMEQLTRVRLTGSVEFRGGYWEDRKREIGGSMISERVYVPDTRKTHINAIDILYAILRPFRDKEFLEREKVIEEEIKRHKDRKKARAETQSKSAHNVWYYSVLLKLKKKMLDELIDLMSRIGLLGYNKVRTIC